MVSLIGKAIGIGVGSALGFFLYIAIMIVPFLVYMFTTGGEEKSWAFILTIVWACFWMIACPASVAWFVEERKLRSIVQEARKPRRRVLWRKSTKLG